MTGALAVESADSITIDANDPRISRFVKALISLGYTEYLSAFNPFVFRPLNWSAHKYNAFPRLRPVIKFLLLNERVDSDGLDEALGTDAWRVLLDLGVATMNGNVAKIDGLALFYFGGLLVFIDSPNLDPTVYFGDDSIGLLTHIAPHWEDAVLDLCSGSGIQGLHSARHARAVDVVEIHPRARAVLRTNVLLNGLSRKVTVHGGSLFDEIEEGRRFDLITANPPLVPFPDDVAYPFVGHGGIDGLAVTRKIVRQLPQRLTDSGRAQIIGLGLSNGREMLALDDYRALAREFSLDIDVTVVSHVPLAGENGQLAELVSTAAPVAAIQRERILETFKSEIDRRGATHMSPYFLLIRKGQGKLAVQNFSRAKAHGPWHVA